MKRLLVIQRRMTHYRVPFFEALKEKCCEAGISLQLAYGDGTPEESAKADSGDIGWAEHLRTRYFLDGELCWQPFGSLISAADMVVVTQENKLLYNLVPQFLDRQRRFAFWGHGANLQGDATSLRERFKLRVSRSADWWFGYTDMSVPLIERSGFPRERITVLNNSVDLSEMAAELTSITEEERSQLRSQLGLSGEYVAAYIGSLYSTKRVEFMLDSARQIRELIPNFEIIIIGAGPQGKLVEDFCSKYEWAKYTGSKTGREKIALLSVAKILLTPGGVGLGMLDSFVCGLPLVTTDCGLHGPEIAYLDNHVNGVMTENDMESYVATVISLFNNPSQIAALRAGCLASAKRYSIDNMAKNFVDGALRCLENPIVRFVS
jgi:glycosyltransferase involved in cell wall biosynthesis